MAALAISFPCTRVVFQYYPSLPIFTSEGYFLITINSISAIIVLIKYLIIKLEMGTCQQQPAIRISYLKCTTPHKYISVRQNQDCSRFCCQEGPCRGNILRLARGHGGWYGKRINRILKAPLVKCKSGVVWWTYMRRGSYMLLFRSLVPW